tara:strand:+ start:891 stop:1460 length:570 start_codon:yes stop_codon:yes gene_type:complete
MISAILLAAGKSERMNNENKLLKKINDISLVSHSIKNILASSIDELIIVLGFQKEKIENVIEKNKKIKIVINEKYENGMSSSIITGLNNLSKNTEAFFICLSDMPFVSKKVYNKLILNKNYKDIIVPTYKKQQGNPVLFSINMKKQIMNIKGDSGAKKILELNKDKILNIEIDHSGIIQNFNTVSDFNS